MICICICVYIYIYIYTYLYISMFIWYIHSAWGQFGHPVGVPSIASGSVARCVPSSPAPSLLLYSNDDNNHIMIIVIIQCCSYDCMSTVLAHPCRRPVCLLCYLPLCSLPTPNLLTKIIPTKIPWLEIPGEFLMDMRIPPLRIKILLESNPPKSRILVGKLGVESLRLGRPRCHLHGWAPAPGNARGECVCAHAFVRIYACASCVCVVLCECACAFACACMCTHVCMIWYLWIYVYYAILYYAIL